MMTVFRHVSQTLVCHWSASPIDPPPTSRDWPNQKLTHRLSPHLSIWSPWWRPSLSHSDDDEEQEESTTKRRWRNHPCYEYQSSAWITVLSCTLQDGSLAEQVSRRPFKEHRYDVTHSGRLSRATPRPSDVLFRKPQWRLWALHLIVYSSSFFTVADGRDLWPPRDPPPVKVPPGNGRRSGTISSDATVARQKRVSMETSPADTHDPCWFEQKFEIWF